MAKIKIDTVESCHNKYLIDLQENLLHSILQILATEKKNSTHQKHPSIKQINYS